MRILSFVGTRPEIIKTLAFCRAALRVSGLEFCVMYTGQNFGPKMSTCFWEELNIPIERFSSGVDRASIGAIACSLLDFVMVAIGDYQPDAIILGLV